MRPGRIRPGNSECYSGGGGEGRASMRPGRIRPGNVEAVGRHGGEFDSLQ